MDLITSNKTQKDSLVGKGIPVFVDPTHKGSYKQKSCKFCNKTYDVLFPAHLYCSEPCRRAAATERMLLKLYKLTREEWLEMHINQRHKCAICGGEGFTMSKHHEIKLVVDHCHKTGVVRGLLCHNCNRALGLLHDNVDHLKTAIRYLESATTISKESTPK